MVRRMLHSFGRAEPTGVLSPIDRWRSQSGFGDRGATGGGAPAEDLGRRPAGAGLRRSEKSDGVNMTPLSANISPKWGHDVREECGLIACGRGLTPRVVSPLLGL